MKKLFIIGNGFDLAHNIKSSYNDFRDYLVSIAGDKYDKYETMVPEPHEAQDGDVYVNDDNSAALLIKLFDNMEADLKCCKCDSKCCEVDLEWKKIELDMGHMDYENVFDSLVEQFDRDGDQDARSNMESKEDLSNELYESAKKLHRFFYDWIKGIEFENIEPEKDFLKLIDGESKFLTFNYTKTLESDYDVNPNMICHIHGSCDDSIDNVYFGHGNKKGNDEQYSIEYFGATNVLYKILDLYRKPGDEILEHNIEFFDELSSQNNKITQIYSYGFSYGEVDSAYLKKIFEKLDTKNMIWFFNDFDSEKIVSYMKLLKEYGFEGTFDIFHIN